MGLRSRPAWHRVFLALFLVPALFGQLCGSPDGGLPSDNTSPLPDARQHTLTVQTQGEGSVILDPPGGVYDGDIQVSLTPVATSGWRFDHWEGALTGDSYPLAVTVNADVVIAAVFVENSAPSPLFPLSMVPLPQDQYSSIPLATPPAAGTLPVQVDLRSQMPPVGNQGTTQGSCVAWAVAYALKSYQENAARSWGVANADHQFSPAYIYNQIKVPGNCLAGSYISDALSLLSQQGCCTLLTMPYDSSNCTTPPSTAARTEAARYKIAYYRRVNVQDATEVKTNLAAGFPVVIGFKVYTNFWKSWWGKTAVYSETQGILEGRHAMCVVGYDDSIGTFRIMNSWGQSWGDDGYFRIPYTLFQQLVFEGYVAQNQSAENTAPAANPQSLTVSYNTATAITLTGTDPDNRPQPLTYEIVTPPGHGTLTGTGPNRTYTPASGYSGPDSFTFYVDDGAVCSIAATVSINVTPPPPANIAPTVTNPTATGTLTQGQAGTIAVSCTARDTDGTVQSVKADLSSIGGSAVRALTKDSNDRWSWSGSVTPSLSGVKTITFTATDNTGALSQPVTASITVGSKPTLQEDMALVPAGEFQMGNSFTSEGNKDESPSHQVYVNAFYIAAAEVTNQQYADALNWANAQGNLISVVDGLIGKYNSATEYPYCCTTSSTEGCYSQITWNGSTFGVNSGKENYPIQRVSWYGAAAYANWRSAMEGKPLCYDLSTWQCNFDDGYRLPTEAEWEKAARGGAASHRFPWSSENSIQHARANYNSSSTYTYDNSPTRGYHPAFSTAGKPYTNDVKYFAPNGYNLYDMAGNVSEWCNDWYSDTYYSSGPYNNPHGPTSGTERVVRGGSWSYNASCCRVAYRNASQSPDNRGNDMGFRLALGTP